MSSWCCARQQADAEESERCSDDDAPCNGEEGEGHEEPSASPLSSFFNLYNSIVGAGVLAVPYALKLSGLIPGLVCVVIVFFLSSYSFQVLARLSHETRKFSYKGEKIQCTHALSLPG